MLEAIRTGWLYMAAMNPTLPYLATTLAFYLGCYGIRKALPGVWQYIASLLPFAKAITEGEDVARQFFLALPQVVVSAVLAGLATGDVKGAIFGAIAGAGAPLLHHTRKALPFDPYKGALGEKKNDKDPPEGGNAVAAISRLKPPPRDLTDPPPPAAAFKRWVYPTTFALTLVVGSCVSLTGCSPSAWQAQRDASDVVATVANDTVKPSLVAAYRSTGLLVIRNQPTEESARLAIQIHQLKWKPVWEAWEAFELAHKAWQDQIAAEGNPLPAAMAARDAYCKLRPLAAEWDVELPNFPLSGCAQ